MTASARGTMEEPGSEVRQKAGLNRSFLDVSPGAFRKRLLQKVEEHGGVFVLVNPVNSSRTCYACGHVIKENRPSRGDFACVACGHEEDADVNAARVLLACGMEKLKAEGLSVSACGDLWGAISAKQEMSGSDVGKEAA